MSIDQVLAIAGAMGSLEGQDSNLDKALKEYEAGAAKLLDQNGKPLYNPEEQARRHGALVEKVERTVEGALQRVEEAEKLAAVEMGALAGDPSKWLSAADLERANARSGFVKEDVMNLPVHQLAERLEQVIAEKDAISAWLYSRYVPGRLAAINRSDEGAGRVYLALQTINELAMPKEVKDRAAKAAALKERAMDLGIKARGVLGEANGDNARARQDFQRLIFGRVVTR